jgi:prepilin signal peptidase PulO-like enzyme (type II secretory pathway)
MITFILQSIFFLSWSILLRHTAAFLIAHCVTQQKKLSLFSPIDLVSTAWWLLICHQVTLFFPAYFIFLSALQITIYTDLTHMLISRFVSLYLIPIGIAFAYFDALPLSPIESIIAAIAGYAFFWMANKVFYFFKGHDGMGQGDLELIACIGAFTGFLGCWFTILFGSLFGTILGYLYMLVTKKSVSILPFGPFLALGATIFIVLQSTILTYLIQTI